MGFAMCFCGGLLCAFVGGFLRQYSPALFDIPSPADILRTCKSQEHLLPHNLSQ